MAIKFHLPGGMDTDIVAQSYDGFPVRTAEAFLVFVRALAASGPGVSSPTPLANFLASHPQVKRFVEAPKPAPASFATGLTTASTPSVLPTGTARAATSVTGSGRKQAKT